MNRLIIHTNEKENPLGDLYGIFFEDLNHAADGGLYAEAVRNRAFEFSSIDNPSYRPLTAWKKIEKDDADISAAVENKEPLSRKNPHYLMLDVRNPGGGAGIMNMGYNTGFYFEKGKEYRFSFHAKTACDMNFDMNIRVSLQGADGTVYASENIKVSGSEWKKYTAVLISDGTDSFGRLAITAENAGKLYIDMVSLFPKDTYKNRPNGMRKDIAELLADLKPKFMRFPGGCLIHDGSLNGDDRDSMYRWKNTLGELYDRPARRNNWGYNQSLGIGYYEYFVFCEDIGAKPVPILPAGYNPHSGQAAALDDLDEWVNDALDLIEFANGDTSTKWGKIRAELGHEEPFGLEYLGIGNEEIGREFFERYSVFHKAIKAKYPEIKLINTSGPFQSGEEYERGWKSARDNGSDLVDEHYYQSPEWFTANNKRYDNFKRGVPKVFLGEYATWGNTYYNAVVEASFMTALERNSHAVALACYAPLLANADYVNWQPDMIFFDNHRVYPTANYYVQKMFMNNQGTHTLKIEKEGFEKKEFWGDGKISGRIEIEAEKCLCDFYDISITNDATGEIKKYGDIKNTCDLNFIDNIDLEKYTIRFKAKRISGDRGFILYLRKNDDTFVNWTMGGWANSDSALYSIINRRNSCLDHKVFSVDSGMEYSFELKISAREMTAYINGEKNLYANDRPAEVEELYVSSSTDEDNGNIIIKAVNLRNEETKAEIVLGGISGGVSGVIYELAGYEPDDKNSFENPDLIKPAEKSFSSGAPEWEYTFPERSVTVFSLKKK
ncbi:MAG: carbohydrate binding domain-containing protein [Oscillospiraceae bacterium]|nr:carbohydrate binding domain-containing protein [Oscillospiraceae bacterium]